MPAPNTYQVKSVKFTPAGGSQQTLTGVQDASASLGGERVAWDGDGSVTAQAQHLEGIEGSVTIVTTDQSILHDSNWQPGTGGSLEVVKQQRATNGKGAVSGADKTLTAANALITDVSEGLPHRGVGTLNITITCVDPDGAAPFAYS